MFVDISPLRESRDFRAIMGGQLISLLGTQLTTVAVPFQVYKLTHSSLDVGLVSLAALFPLMAGSLLGGSVIDAVDRRRLLIVVDLLMAVTSAGLAVNADLGPSLWPLFVFPAAASGLAGFDAPARNAIVPNLIRKDQIPAAAAMFQALFQMGAVVGPALAGLLLAGAGVRFVYWLDVASMAASVGAAFLIAPQPPAPGSQRPGLKSVVEGLAFLRGRQGLQGAYLIDVCAMVFGMPRALFPALALTTFGGGPSILGLLYAAPGAGALIGAITTGWVNTVRRQGRAVTACVLVWGGAIAVFGLLPWLWAALVLLAVAGWADVISAVFRNTIVQLSVPDRLRGRLNGLQIGVVQGGPRLGDLESGAVATLFDTQISIVSGGILCIIAAVGLVWARPGFRRLSLDPHAPAEEDGEVAGVTAVSGVSGSGTGVSGSGTGGLGASGVSGVSGSGTGVSGSGSGTGTGVSGVSTVSGSGVSGAEAPGGSG